MQRVYENIKDVRKISKGVCMLHVKCTGLSKYYESKLSEANVEISTGITRGRIDSKPCN